MGSLEWDPIPEDTQLGEVYNYLDEKKKQRLNGDDGDDFIRRKEAHQMVEKAQEEARRELRDEIIRGMSDHGLTNREVGEIVDLSPSRVSQLKNSAD